MPKINCNCSYYFFKADPVLQCIPIVSSINSLVKLTAKAAIASTLKGECLSKERLHKNYYFTWVRKESIARNLFVAIPLIGQLGVLIYTLFNWDSYCKTRDDVVIKVKATKQPQPVNPDLPIDLSDASSSNSSSSTDTKSNESNHKSSQSDASKSESSSNDEKTPTDENSSKSNSSSSQSDASSNESSSNNSTASNPIPNSSIYSAAPSNIGQPSTRSSISSEKSQSESDSSLSE